MVLMREAENMNENNLSQYLEFVRSRFLEYVKALLEIQEKVEEEEKIFHPKVLNRVFGEVCAFCNMGRFIEERHKDLSFPESEKYVGAKDEESCPLKQMRESIMDKILEK